jgi:tRNA threonylcarbamoyladenosine biosynthesis protein TsaB
MILNIETATEICSVCLSKGGKVIAIRETDEKNIHASLVTVFIEECFREAGAAMQDMQAVAISAGPGSYTGLRVGLSTGKGISYALDKPLIVIDTLKSLAFACREKEDRTDVLYCPMIDARRMEVYTTLYDADFNIVEAAQALVVEENSFEMYFKAGKKIVFCGNGALKCVDLFKSPEGLFSPVYCSAANLVGLSAMAFMVKDFADPAFFSPNYIKPPNITAAKGNF